MKKIIFLIIILSFLFGTVSFAQEAELPNPGLTPDSFFYFLDTLSEKIGMFFTFGAEKKAEKALKYAEEKLAEVKAMAEENKTKALEKANKKYEKFLDLSNTKAKEAKEKGKDVERLVNVIAEKTLKHQEVLLEVFEKVPEQAKDAVQKTIEISKRGFEEAVKAVSGAKKEELQQKPEEESEAVTIPNAPMMLDIDVSTTAGSPYTIGWRAAKEATNYILERDTNSLFSNPIIVSSRTLNSFSETLSPSVSTRYYFRVKACNKYGCSSWSKTTELWVEVPPSITVISPNGGEKWIIGKTYNIKWSSTGLDKVTVDLFAYSSEGQVIKGFQHFIAKSIEAAKGYYNWTIPEIADYPNYKLRIYNKLCTGGDELLAECKKTQYFDESDNYFSIISSTVWEALSACEKIRETSDIELRQRCVAMVKKDSFACEILKDPETYCYKDVALVIRDSAICEKIKDSGRRGACEALAERVPAKCGGWIYADYCYEEVAALTGDALICNLINYSRGKTDCKAVVLKDVSYCENSDSEDCYQILALLTGDEEVCERLKERNDLERVRDLNQEVSKCIKMAKREITGCRELSGTGIDCDMIPVVTKNPSWCEKLEINRNRCYFYTALRIADLLPLELILLRN